MPYPTDEFQHKFTSVLSVRVDHAKQANPMKKTAADSGQRTTRRGHPLGHRTSSHDGCDQSRGDFCKINMLRMMLHHCCEVCLSHCGSLLQRLLALDFADMAEEKRPALFVFDLKTNMHTKT